MTVLQAEPGSFRDRKARVMVAGDRVFRAVDADALEDWRSLAGSTFFDRWIEESKLISTWRVERPTEVVESLGPGWSGLLEHRRVPFVSYPYEWSFSMLRDAALLELELLDEAIAEDLVLKDGSPYNVQWLDARPIHIDVPSFERWDGQRPWPGYQQFCQLFLFPLMIQAYRGVDFQPWLRGAIEGISTRQCRNFMSAGDLFKRGVLSHVVLHDMLRSGAGDWTPKLGDGGASRQTWRKLIQKNARRLHRLVGRLKVSPARSSWSRYAPEKPYSEEDRAAKSRNLEEFCAGQHWKTIWDLGCNTGEYSFAVAAHADLVVAMDADHTVIDRLYMDIKARGAQNILPLVMDIADPSPALGWRHGERSALESRGPADLIVCFALIHHLVIGANIPLDDLVAWLAANGANLFVEFVTREDPMVQKLLSTRDDAFEDYDLGRFESAIAAHFTVVDRRPLPSGTRIMYALQSQSGT